MALRGLAAGLERLGHRVRWIAPRDGGHTDLLSRLAFNAGLAVRSDVLPELDLAVGVDLDGVFLRPAVPYVVMLKGVAADEARHESGRAALGLRVAGSFEAANARRADGVVVPSRYSSEAVQRAYGLPQERIAVVPEPVLPPEADGADSHAPARPRPTVLSVARQYPRKRTDVLLRAVPELAERISDVRVRIVGDGPELPALEELARELGVTDRVVFRGRIPDGELAREYAGADVFCLPSEQEAYGIAAVEAMAAGLPVVAARAAALPEVVDEGVDGLLVEPGRAGPLTDALVRLLRDPGLRERMGRAGRRKAEARGPIQHARAFLEACPVGRR